MSPVEFKKSHVAVLNLRVEGHNVGKVCVCGGGGGGTIIIMCRVALSNLRARGTIWSWCLRCVLLVPVSRVLSYGMDLHTLNTLTYTHLHGSPCMVRPLPFPRSHKREASGGFCRTKYSPKVSLKRCEKGPE